MRRYVYHAEVEPSPRATASGNQNVITLGAMAPISSMVIDRGCVDCGGGRPTIAYDPIVVMPYPIRPVGPAYPVVAPYYGTTASVPQPPPSSGTTLSVPNPTTPPVSPQPSPVIGAPTPLSLAQPGQTVAAATGTPLDFTAWFGESTIISGVPNWTIAAAGAVLALMMFSKGGRR